MNRSFVLDILKRMPKVDPPGCCGTFVDHPFPPYRDRQSVEIGFVIEHRFAFHYWIKCKQRLMYDSRTRSRLADDEFSPPDLITWDWHDDFGGECDYIESELKRLDQSNEEEVAFFCWAGLRPINDGHIAPAVWLNAVGNVYILQKQRDRNQCERSNRDYTDRYGRKHKIRYFRSPYNLAKTFDETKTDAGVIWDVDMDFFTEENVVPDRRYARPVSKQITSRILNPKKPWMRMILGDLKAITIALEPEYTGGLTPSLALYHLWEHALFTTPIFSEGCRWRNDLF